MKWLKAQQLLLVVVANKTKQNILSFSSVVSTGSSHGTRQIVFFFPFFYIHVTHNCILLCDFAWYNIKHINNKNPTSTIVTTEGLALPSDYSTDWSQVMIQSQHYVSVIIVLLLEECASVSYLMLTEASYSQTVTLDTSTASNIQYLFLKLQVCKYILDFKFQLPIYVYLHT